MSTGLCLCKCNHTIGDVVDIDALSDWYGKQGIEVMRCDELCSADCQKELFDNIREKEWSGVVLGACSPKHYETTKNQSAILQSIADAGINPNKIAFANLREQLALPNSGDGVLEKAKCLIDVAISKIEHSEDVLVEEIPPRRSALIIGASISGVFAALRLVNVGYKVHIVDKGEIGDFSEYITPEELAKIDVSLTCAMTPSFAGIEMHPNVVMYPETALTDVYGRVGDYTVQLSGDEILKVGGIIVCVRDAELTSKLRPILHIDVDSEGYFKPKNPAVVVETRDPGKYLAVGDDVRSDILAADSAVLSLTSILDKNEINHIIEVSEVDEDVCGGCGTCVKTCMFHATSIDAARNVSVTDAARCVGCGNCVVACPTGARDLVRYPNSYMIDAIRILGGFEMSGASPKVLAMLCDGGGYPAADRAGLMGLTYPTGVLPLRVSCAGRVDTQFILYAFKVGFDGVFIGECPEGACQNIVGNTDLARRANLFREVLRSRAIDTDRLRIEEISPIEGDLFAEAINEFVDELRGD